MRRPEPRVRAGLAHPPALDIPALDTAADIALTHAVGREIIHAGLADQAFIARATSGFEEYRRLVEPWTPSLAAKVTGVPVSAVRELARVHARPDRRPAVVEYRRGEESEHVRALANLSLLTGRAGGAGGRRTPFELVRHDPPVDLTDECYPVRLTTGRRLTAVRGGAPSPLRRSGCVELCPEDAERYGVVVGEEVRVSSRRDSLVAAVWIDTELRPGLAFTAAAREPGEGDTGLPATGVNCPIAGTAEFTASAIRIERLPAGLRAPADEGAR